MKTIVIVLLVLFIRVSPAAAAPPLAAAIPPLATLAARVAPGAPVTLLVRPGAEAHTWDPKPADLAGLSQVKLLLATGLEFEAPVASRLAGVNPAFQVVRLDAGMPLLPYPERGCAPGCGHAHAPGVPDPHVWLSPRRMATMAVTLGEALARADPGGAAGYRANAAAFAAECRALDAELAVFLAPLRGRAFLSFHASWGYFADDYGMRMIPVESGGREPGPADLARIIALARKEGARAMLVQPQFGSRAPERIAEAAGVRLLPADDLAADWAGNLRRVASALRSAEGAGLPE